jgi:hypothetical protein
LSKQKYNKINLLKKGNMKTRNFLYLLMLILTSLLFAVSSCNKSDTDDNSDMSLATDNSIVQSVFDQPQSMADQAATYGSLQTFILNNSDVDLLSSCATITHDSVSIPRKLTINFGTTNCWCNDGKARRGKIIVSYTGFYRDSGTVITFTFDNYAVNDYVVTNTSTKVITNKGRKTNGHPWFTIYENGGVIKPSNGRTISWISNRENEWIAGYNTRWYWADDEYLISGTASGVTATTLAYTMTIKTPLHIMLNCHNVVAGVVDITPLAKDTYTLDYGNGTCDNQATVTYKNKTFNITI